VVGSRSVPIQDVLRWSSDSVSIDVKKKIKTICLLDDETEDKPKRNLPSQNRESGGFVRTSLPSYFSAMVAIMVAWLNWLLGLKTTGDVVVTNPFWCHKAAKNKGRPQAKKNWTRHLKRRCGVDAHDLVSMVWPTGLYLVSRALV